MSKNIVCVKEKSSGILKIFLKYLEATLEEFLPAACSLCLRNISLDKFPRNICDRCLSQLSLRNIESNLFTMEDPSEKKFNFTNISLDYLYYPDYQNYSKWVYTFICTYYDQYIKNMVRKLKFHEGLEFVPVLADLIYMVLERTKRNSLSEYKEILNFDYIVPVPLHEKRFYERGYNQVELVANELALLSGVKVLNVLKRVKNTKRQSEMKSKEDRLNNVENAFTCKEAAVIMGKKVLLMDDVVSSGKTLWEAAKTLSHSGAEVLALAITGNQE